MRQLNSNKLPYVIHVKALWDCGNSTDCNSAAANHNEKERPPPKKRNFLDLSSMISRPAILAKTISEVGGQLFFEIV